MYNNNWDGCRDLWKESYRKRKLLRLIDRPIVPPDPKIVEYERQQRERRQAEADRFNRAQQKRYEEWLAARKNKRLPRESPEERPSTHPTRNGFHGEASNCRRILRFGPLTVWPLLFAHRVRT
jgi:hypothetical protein